MADVVLGPARLALEQVVDLPLRDGALQDGVVVRRLGFPSCMSRRLDSSLLDVTCVSFCLEVRKRSGVLYLVRRPVSLTSRSLRTPSPD